MPSRINIGPENGPYVAINEENGNLQLEDNSGNVVAEWDDGQSQWDFVENDISGVGAFDSESVNTEKQRITDRETVTVDIPTDFDTVNDALIDIVKRRVPYGTRINVNIESGHHITTPFYDSLTSQLWLPHVRIVSEDETALVDSSFPSDGILIEPGQSSHGATLNALIDMQGEGGRGMRLSGTVQHVDGGGGIKNAGDDLITMTRSWIRAHNTVWEGGDRFLATDEWSFGSFEGAYVDDCAGMGAELQGGNFDMQEITIENCGSYGLRNEGGYIYGRDATIQNNGAESGHDGVQCESLGHVNLRGATVTGNDRNDLDVRRAGQITILLGETTSGDGEADTADCSVSEFNTIEGNDGIIWGPTA